MKTDFRDAVKMVGGGLGLLVAVYVLVVLALAM